MLMQSGFGKGGIAVLAASLLLVACGGDDDNSSSASTSASSSSAASSSEASSAESSSQASTAATGLVFVADFGTVASGLTDNTETTIESPIDLPTVTNTNGYTAQLSGKLKMNTTQSLPGSGSDDTWTTGVVQFSNNTSKEGKVTVYAVDCPFTLLVHHSPSNSTDTVRKLVITFGGAEVYNDGGGVEGATATPGYTASLDSTTTSTTCTTGTTDIVMYGWNGSQGSGVRIYDVQITR